MDTLEKVREFHQGIGAAIPALPTTEHIKSRAKLRIDLIEEELEELCEAVKENDHVGMLDALTDIQYVLDGAYLDLGFSRMKNAAFDEVHRSNMTKLIEPIYREDGKLLKGRHYSPPNLKDIVYSFEDAHRVNLR